MRYLGIIASMIFAHSAAADIAAVCTIPTANEAQMAALCETFRTTHRIASAAWSIDDCTSEFMRRGARRYSRDVNRSAAVRAKDTAIKTNTDTFDAEHPEAFTRTTCGDGIVQGEFGETCDDGNRIQGDGCSRCLIES